jgi:hypothetical protein
MYPGVVYTDTVFRWNRAFALFAGQQIDDTNPIGPYLLMWPLHQITGEIGLYAFLQCFLLTFGILRLVLEITGPERNRAAAIGVLLASAMMFTPIQLIYAVFHSFDVAAATIILWLSIVLIRLWSGRGNPVALLTYACGLLVVLVAYRLPALPIALLTALCAFAAAYKRTRTRLIYAGLVPCLLLLLVPFALGRIVGAVPTSLWVSGPSWRYVYMAPQARNPIHEAFVQDLERNLGQKRLPPCLDNIYCSNYWPLLDHIRINPAKKEQFLQNFQLLAVEEPWLFIKTHLIFAGRVLGIQAPLANAEIGRWREPIFKPQMEALGFHPGPRHERIADVFNDWMAKSGAFLLRPFYLSLGTLLIVAVLWAMRGRELGIRCAIPLGISMLYYATFMPVSQSHELRYFYPALLMMVIVWIVGLANSMGSAIDRPVREQ